MNGMIPNLVGRELSEGYATYGSDSGHQGFGFPGFPGGGRGPGGFRQGGSGGPGASPPSNPNDWWLNDEAVDRNLGYMQMKKTHDAAMVDHGTRLRMNGPNTTITLERLKVGEKRDGRTTLPRRL